jgi:hypothetical protein
MRHVLSFAITLALGLSLGALLKADSPDAPPAASSKVENVEAQLPNLIYTLTTGGCGMPKEAEDLVRIGKPAVPALMIQLDRSHWPTRWKATRVLGQIGPDAKDALPQLERNLTRPDRHLLEKKYDTLAIAGIKSDPKPLIEALESGQALGDPRTDYAVELLGKMGPTAKDALPILKRLVEKSRTKSPSKQIGIEALKKIEAADKPAE